MFLMKTRIHVLTRAAPPSFLVCLSVCLPVSPASSSVMCVLSMPPLQTSCLSPAALVSTTRRCFLGWSYLLVTFQFKFLPWDNSPPSHSYLNFFKKIICLVTEQPGQISCGLAGTQVTS